MNPDDENNFLMGMFIVRLLVEILQFGVLFKQVDVMKLFRLNIT